MSPAWRRRCPRGHSNISNRQGNQFKCHSCGTHYAGTPLDAATNDFPLPDADERECGSTPHKYAVLNELLRRYGDGERVGLKAKELSANTQSAAASLAQLREDGMVDKLEYSTAARWRPTAKGRQQQRVMLK